MRHVLFLCILALGCAPIDPTHPLDPDTPRELQASCTVVGSLQLPSQFDDALVTRIEIHLVPLEENKRSYRVNAREDARFVMPDIVPGQYRFYAQGPGVKVDAFFVNATAGTELDLGALPLEPVIGLVKGIVFSVSGNLAVGAIVSADDEFESTITNTEGEFALRTYAGQRVLAISYEDHYAWASSPITIDETDEVILEDPIFVLPINGKLQGAVRLRQYATPGRTQGLQFELRPKTPDESETDVQFARDNRVIRRDFDLTSDGQIELRNIVPGEYTLTISASGYDRYRRPVVIHPNRTTTLGVMELTHESTGPNAVSFSGRLRSGLSGLTAVAVVVSIDDPTERVPFVTVLTDSTGRFSVPASSADYYHIFADVTGFRDVDKGPYRYDPKRGFIDSEDEAPDINLSAADNL